MKIKIPVKNKVQIVPKITDAKKDMLFMETWRRNTITTFNAKKNGAIVNKYFILISGKYILKLIKMNSILVELHHKQLIRFPFLSQHNSEILVPLLYSICFFLVRSEYQ